MAGQLRHAQQQRAAWQADAHRAQQGEAAATRALEAYASQGADGAVSQLLAELRATQAELRARPQDYQPPLGPPSEMPPVPVPRAGGVPLTPRPPASAAPEPAARPAALARAAEGSGNWGEVSALSSQASSLLRPPPPQEEPPPEGTLESSARRGDLFGVGAAAAPAVTPPPPEDASGAGAERQRAALAAARATAAEEALAAARAEGASLAAVHAKLQAEVPTRDFSSRSGGVGGGLVPCTRCEGLQRLFPRRNELQPCLHFTYSPYMYVFFGFALARFLFFYCHGGGRWSSCGGRTPTRGG